MIKQGILLIVAGLFLIACKDKDNKPHQHSPAFQSSIPADGSSDVKTDIEISITFDESISLLYTWNYDKRSSSICDAFFHGANYNYYYS